MKAKNLIIIFIIIAAIGGGFYLFQKSRHDKDLLAHKKQQLQQIIKVAEKSSSAGFLVMASAINKFYQIKGHYPDTLLKLYPEFIPEKPFISILKWKYTQGKGTYLLQRSIKGSQVMASMGPDLRFKTEVSASSSPAKMVASVNKSNDLKQPVKKAGIQKISQTEPAAKKNTKNIELAKVFSQESIKVSRDTKSKKEKKPSKAKPAISIVKKELNKKETYLLSFTGRSLYIWKSKDGTIGFSDTQYPDEKKLVIYRDQSWIEYIENPDIQ